MKKIKIGSDFSGVGAFDYAIKRVAEKKNLDLETIFSCDWDKYARITYAHNHGEPKYFPKDVYDREIPEESLDVYMTSPPCQAFSIAGKRQGKNDSKGILFFNSHEFIKQNKPRFFIFENVKGLLSDDNGNTFREWVNMLGGKSVNGSPILFSYENSVPYHLYYQVLNSKKHGVPQNRERIFLVGIRDDEDNSFQFPKEEHLTKRLKDVLENEVDQKYFLSEKYLKGIVTRERHIGFTDAETKDSANCIVATYHKQPTDGEYLKIKSATSKGYETATENDSINFSVPNSETRRGRVGKGVAQTLDTQCNQGVLIPLFHWGKGKNNERMVYDSDGISPCMTSAMGMGGGYTPSVIDQYKIRRLTPRECFRLQDFSDSFDFSCVSDSQAYKQAGNSITVRVLEKILDKLKL